jgi:hypothetical protein
VEEEGMGKVIESVLTDLLSGFTEKEGLLSPNQFGGRPGRSAVDALLLLMQRIKDALRVGKVASILLMDISQVFPSISHAHLIHLLHVKRVPEAVVGIISSLLSNRRTTLTFDNFHSPLAPVPNGLPQGSPLSALLFLIFADELLHDRDDGGYIDNISRFTASYSLEDNIEDLEEHMERKACPTAERIGLRFDLPKFQLLHFVSPLTTPSTTTLSLSRSPVSQSSHQPAPNSSGSSLTTSSCSESTSS